MAARGTREAERTRIRVSGIVQGVGFRPFIYQLAHRYHLAGWVRNTSEGVLIEVEGKAADLQGFRASLTGEAPPLASVAEVVVESVMPVGEDGFRILHSLSDADARAAIPPDVAACPECLEDIAAPDNRRFRYPFTNCTNCGPRFTIIRAIPYDRSHTTMRDFRMCQECAAEYEDPLDRRFHAQPNACPACGPHLRLDGARGEGDAWIIAEAARLLRAGKVLAVKGLGGFHLACDARNTEAVRALRERKGRSGKPFAVMSADLAEARRICETDPSSEALLLSPERPIVLTPAREGSGISPLVAPGIKTLGVMLPYTPLHHLLLAESPPTLVMTSGNLCEEPIVHRDEEARERLGHIPDHELSHDRPIHVACDDSVSRVFAGMPMVIRRARGYVPRPIELGRPLPRLLACGGDLKSTFCLTKETRALLSQHLGDLANAATLDHYHRMVEHFCRFFAVEPEAVAHDLHPDYRSTAYACALEGRPRIGVQHHHAHIASCLAENQLAGPVIGVAFDGTGYGTDGRIWGGEFLVADCRDFRRAAHLAYVPLPGGEAAIRRPGRMALAYLLELARDGQYEISDDAVPSLSPEEVAAVRLQVERELNAPLTSSMGRLFDAVSALLGVCAEVTYEGQAAIELEGLARPDVAGDYPFATTPGEDGALAIDVRPMIAAILADAKRRPDCIGEIAGRFHAAIAEMTAQVCARIRQETGLTQVALSGGVFQNMLLLGQALERLEARGFAVIRHRRVPTNDGGISLGQAVIAAGRLER